MENLNKFLGEGDSPFRAVMQELDTILWILKEKNVSKQTATICLKNIQPLIDWLNLVLLPDVKVKTGGGDNITYYNGEVYIGYQFNSMLCHRYMLQHDDNNLKPALIKFRAFVLRTRHNLIKKMNAQEINKVQKVAEEICY
jgi:hypothetical protein